MDTSTKLKEGLTANNKYIPVWYRYDMIGSILNERCLKENKFYYFHNSEVRNIAANVQEAVSRVVTPCVLVDMGSGSSEKSRAFIDAILERQECLRYIPVDISAEFLEQCSNALAIVYGKKLDVQPIADDYSVGIQFMRKITEPKLIIWLSACQSLPYNEQVTMMHSIAQTMKQTDRLVLTLDVTQDVQVVENAYLDPTGISAPLYLNGICRLNREYGSNIDTNQFELQGKFEVHTEPDSSSRMVVQARAKLDLSYHIPGLGIDISFKKGECLRLYEGEGVSCKYTELQIRTLAEKSGLKVDRLWIDDENHAALCCLAIA